MVDPELCIGCAYCVQACPYGIRFIHNETGNADKWARVFGRLDDPESEISKRLAKVPTHVLKEHLGTFPRLRYLGISAEVT